MSFNPALFHSLLDVRRSIVNIRYLLSLFLLQIILMPGISFAGPVELEILTPEAVVGENLSFSLKFSLEDENAVVDVSQVKYQGAALPYQVTNRSSSSFTMIVNGKTVRSSSDIVRSYVFSLPTVNVGELILPEFSVSLDGKTYQVGPISFRVLAKPTSENLKFLVAIANPQSYYYPSQVIDLKCQILYRNFPGAPAIENISLPILHDSHFQLIPDDRPNFTLPTDGQQTGVNATQGKINYQGKQFNSMAFHLKLRLMQPGDFQFANNIKMVVETGKRRRQSSFFFGPNIVNETAPLFADSPPLNIRVLELPDKNVPPSFNGAIGQFKIEVTPSSDTAIRVGDPITLAIEISGRGTWEFVKCPPLYKDTNITDYFIVSQEPVIGEVNSSKTSKSFSVRLRVKSKTVKEIPAIAFTYFDLMSRKYVTVHSAPVPITVFAASQTAKITDFNTPKPIPPSQENNVSDSAEQPTPGNQANSKTTDENKLGVIQPILPPLVEIADNFPTSETRTNQAPIYSKLFFALGPLAAVFLLYLIRLFKGRSVSKEKIAKYRSSKAYDNLLSELRKTKTDTDIASFSRALGQRIHTFIEERFLCCLTIIDATTLGSLADQGKVSQHTAKQLLDIVEQIDQQRYGTHSDRESTPGQLLKETIEALEKCNL